MPSRLDSILNIFEKKFKSVPVSLSTGTYVPYPRIPTGLLSLDYILGGGIPQGIVVELWSDEGSGKTTLALQTAASAIKGGAEVLFFDLENVLNMNYAMTLGIPGGKMAVSRPPTGEETFEMINMALPKMNPGDLIIVDSVAALVPKSLRDVNLVTENLRMGALPQLLSQGLNKIRAALSTSKATIIFVNQIREAIGSYVQSYKTPGGHALKHEAALRFQVRKVKFLYDSDDDKTKQKIGIITNVFAEKSKYSAPYAYTDLFLFYGLGFSVGDSAIEAALTSGLATAKGGYIEYAGTTYHGREKFRDALLNDSALMEGLRAAVMAKLTPVTSIPQPSEETPEEPVEETKGRKKTK